ncbi:universal stress protein [Streptomyces ovatisporus]|uniref:Universal stress protein n=1 Tax=Streptomyces ovatisporus TaxID=1128682 RepID=A0ABV9AAP6_9ACTN
MAQPVVVGVDGSDPSLEAVDWAADEAALRGLPLRIVHASRWDRYERIAPARAGGRPATRVMAENTVATAERRAVERRPGLKVTSVVAGRDPVAALVEESASAFAVVVGSRGVGAVSGMLLGSVGLGVAGRASCPTVVVRGTGTEQARRGGSRQVVVGVGKGEEEAAAVRFALREAEVRQCDVQALHAWRRPSDDGATTGGDGPGLRAERLLESSLRAADGSRSGVTTHPETVEGSARDALVRAGEDADLLVVGARKRHGTHGLQLGLVSHAVLHRAPCPVAVVPYG